MHSGDNITTHLFDTSNGLKVTIVDHTTHTSGSMTASAANGFATVKWAPNGQEVHGHSAQLPPEFSTSSPLTRNVNAAHTYNIAFSDEIGHFEYCAKVRHRRAQHLPQAARLRHEQQRHRRAGPDGDDVFCLPGRTRRSSCTSADA